MLHPTPALWFLNEQKKHIKLILKLRNASIGLKRIQPLSKKIKLNVNR